MHLDLLNPRAADASSAPARHETLLEALARLDSSKLTRRLRRAKSAYTTRRVDLERGSGALELLDRAGVVPRAGDLVLARVISIGQHTRIELTTGRRARLHRGDEVIVCYGARYAPHQFEAYVPEDLGRCDLVAAGGIAARCVSRHQSMKAPTAIEPIGILARRGGHRLNLADWALPEAAGAAGKAPVVAVLGTSMNAGKTTAAARLIRGLREQGRVVGAAKVTGTGAGGDRWSMMDAGAHRVVDFTDAGVPSTFGVPAGEVEAIFETLVGSLEETGADVIVVEVADGLCHGETAALVAGAAFKDRVDGVVFAAGDALGAKAGVDMLARLGLRVLCISGVVTASALAVAETERITDLSVTPLESFPDEGPLHALLGAAGPAPVTDASSIAA